MTAWDEERGRKAIETKGPVEWEGRGGRFRLRWVKPACNRWCVDVLWSHKTHWTLYHFVITDHEAACLHRDHARTWLKDHRSMSRPGPYANDAALIAAILAVGEEKK